jgi:glycosyltransferase involved in cell wall biosynthesis
MTPLRVAFFTDSYLEVNGVARTSRSLHAAAVRSGLPFLAIYAGPASAVDRVPGDRLALPRGRLSFALERDLRYDLWFWRHLKRGSRAVQAFNANLVHITGPSDVGQLGAVIAHRLNIPLVGSWHTNLHEYAVQRARELLAFLPSAARNRVAHAIERVVLDLSLQFYRIPRVLLAPSEELAEMLRRRTGKSVYLMRRGVDTHLFTPARRDAADGVIRLGYVGRLSPEKRVRFLATLERALLDAGKSGFRFVIVGGGSEQSWLESNMRTADFAGVLEGEALARAYANMDVFVFPSETETFGNVILESFASGVPAIVTDRGGPKTIVQHGVSGFVAADDQSFIRSVLMLMEDRALRQQMSAAARNRALDASWDRVLEQVCEAYDEALQGRASPQRVRPDND